MKKLIELCHKIFNRTLSIYHRATGEDPVTVINKAFIEDVFVNTIIVLENGKYYFHTHIEITTVDNRVHIINTHENYVRNIPDIPHNRTGVVKYNKYIKKLIKSPFYDYTLENRSHTAFDF